MLADRHAFPPLYQCDFLDVHLKRLLQARLLFSLLSEPSARSLFKQPIHLTERWCYGFAAHDRDYFLRLPNGWLAASLVRSRIPIFVFV